MLKISEYIDAEGNSAFGSSFMELDIDTATKVTTALTRIENRQLSGAKSIGGEVYEYIVGEDPVYRLYIGEDGDELVILSGVVGSQRTHEDVENAKELWKEYKREKKQKK